MNFSNLTPLEIRDLINSYRSELRKLDFQVQHTSSLIQQLEQALEKSELPAVPKPASQAKAGPKKGKGRVKQPEAAAAPKKKGPGRPRKAETATKETTETATAEVKEEPKAKAPKAAKTPKAPKAAKEPKAAKAPRAAKAKKESAPKKEAKPRAEGKKSPGRRSSLSDFDQMVIESLNSRQKAMIMADFVDVIKQNPEVKSGEAQIKVKLNRSLHKLANVKKVLDSIDYPGRGNAYILKEWKTNKGELPKKYAR